MLDRRTKTVLKYINSVSHDGYRVITYKEVDGVLPNNLKMDKKGLENTVLYLEENGYVSLKFHEGDAYCVSPMPKGRLAVEEAERVLNEKKTLNRYLFLFCIMALIGGFIGGVLAELFLMLTNGWWTLC